MKVNIRYIHTGLISAEMPDSIDKNNKRAIRDWAERELEKLNNKELLEGLANLADQGEPIEERIFDDTPYVEAVEEGEYLELIMKTRLWKAYNEDEDEVIGEE